MRFLADMGISPITVAWLRELGHDALHLHDDGLEKAADHVVLEKARVEQRTLLTSDLDFGYLVATSSVSLPSIILFRLTNMRPDNVATQLSAVLSRFEDELSAGSVVVVTDGAIRVRCLPIGGNTEE